MKRISYFKESGYDNYVRVTFVHETSCNNYHWFIPETIEHITKYCFYKQKFENRHIVSLLRKDFLEFADFWSGVSMYQQILKYGEEA